MGSVKAVILGKFYKKIAKNNELVQSLGVNTVNFGVNLVISA